MSELETKFTTITCDRCGAEGREAENVLLGWATLQGKFRGGDGLFPHIPFSYAGGIDLCENCTRSLRSWCLSKEDPPTPSAGKPHVP